MTQESSPSIPTSTVYGPVASWRLGKSLGVDLNYVDSICSFQCIYCQLGKINVHTAERRVFVSTERVIADLLQAPWKDADVISISGSGEPTLALNLGEVIKAIKETTGKPVAVLTNSTLLLDQDVRRDLGTADKVFCKLDAATDRTFKLVNRPAEGVTLADVKAGIVVFRREYKGFLAIQTMLLPILRAEIDQLAADLKEMQPDEIQLNLPTRPIPRQWLIEWRGSHDRSDEDATRIKLLPASEVSRIAARIEELTGLKVVSPRQVATPNPL